MPACTIPTLQDAQAVQMAADTAVTAPEPTARSVVMVFLPQMPVCAHATPMTLVIAPQRTATVQMYTNSFVSTPPPAGATVQTVVVVISAVQLPETANHNPPGTSPTQEIAPAVEVSTNAFGSAPDPAIWSGVMVAPPQMPVSTNSAPVALVVTVEGAVTVQMQTNAPVAAPSPLMATMEPVVVMVFAVQVPI